MNDILDYVACLALVISIGNTYLIYKGGFMMRRLANVIVAMCTIMKHHGIVTEVKKDDTLHSKD